MTLAISANLKGSGLKAGCDVSSVNFSSKYSASKHHQGNSGKMKKRNRRTGVQPVRCNNMAFLLQLEIDSHPERDLGLVRRAERSISTLQRMTRLSHQTRRRMQCGLWRTEMKAVFSIEMRGMISMSC
jgi:hypothetical protein